MTCGIWGLIKYVIHACVTSGLYVYQLRYIEANAFTVCSFLVLIVLAVQLLNIDFITSFKSTTHLSVFRPKFRVLVSRSALHENNGYRHPTLYAAAWGGLAARLPVGH
jgi:hypothetical protein